MVTIVICFQSGTESMMEVCLGSIARHTRFPYELIVASRDSDLDELDIMLGKMPCESRVVRLDMVCPGYTTSRVHGMMLDQVIPDMVESEYVLTLDSDAFPMADGWLEELVAMVQNGGCSGILHPWGPPPENMARDRIEWKVRSQQCWKHTHVACQLVRTDFFEETDVKFNAGDDTGLLIPQKMVELGLSVRGFKPTRCPKPLDSDFDAEFNRYVGIVYGDRVYHHGGFTRISMGDGPIFDKNFGWVFRAILVENGSEWLLDDEKSYIFQFDKEEDVALEKMARLFGMESQRMPG